MYKLTILGSTRNLRLLLSHYNTGNKAITASLSNGEPWAVLSVNLEGLTQEEVAIKNYSEGEGVYEQLVSYKIIHPAHRFLNSGNVTGIPVCKLNTEVCKTIQGFTPQ